MTGPSTPAPAGAADPAKQTWINRVITATPVVLSVVATVLAGLSSRELTLAHYYRSLATQQQSKADDQWNFFQAKRIRATVVEMATAPGDGLPGAEPVDAARLEAAAARVAEDLGRARRATDRLRQAVDAAGDDLGPAAGPLRAAVEKLTALLRDRPDRAERARRELGQTLTRPGFQEAFTYLDGDRLPEAEKRPAEDENLRNAVAAVAARRPEEAVAGPVRRTDLHAVEKAIAAAEETSGDFDARTEPVNKALKQLDAWMAGQANLVGPVVRAARAVRAALADVPAGDRKGLNEVRAAGADLGRTADALAALAEEGQRDYRQAERSYTARRYDREGQYNRDVAQLYEVLVRKLGEISEGHRQKSVRFFYAMLAAQGGVTIAALAMAVRYRSVLWSLATVAGVGALVFAGYVYVGM